MQAILEVVGLVKTFASVTAVDQISFSIERGSCFGLLGPNGAGKTTTVEMLEGLQVPSRGYVRYNGRALDKQFSQDAGIMFQNTALQDFMTVREALIMFSRFYTQSVDISRLIDQCALAEFIDRDTRKLSGGQKQRLLLAIALINDPKVLFLDEPTTGLDPQARRNFWRLLESIKLAGKTIVLTTHYMEEAGALCDELIFIDHGKVIAQGSPATLLEDHFNDVVLKLPLVAVQNDSIELDANPVVQSLRTTETHIEILTQDANACIAWLLQNKVSLAKLETRNRDLEDLFLALTGHDLRA